MQWSMIEVMNNWSKYITIQFLLYVVKCLCDCDVRGQKMGQICSRKPSNWPSSAWTHLHSIDLNCVQLLHKGIASNWSCDVPPWICPNLCRDQVELKNHFLRLEFCHPMFGHTCRNQSVSPDTPCHHIWFLTDQLSMLAKNYMKVAIRKHKIKICRKG